MEDEQIPPSALAQRLDELEGAVSSLQAQVERLRETVEKLSGSGHPAPPHTLPRTPPRTRAPGRETSPASRLVARLQVSWNSEDWLNKIGIGLLLFAVAFLFKYSIDEGWLTPPVRIAFGLAVGLTLMLLGLRLRASRHRLRQVLLGGGIGTFYATIFAAYQLYAMVAYPVAFAFMCAVTLSAFFLAVHQRDAVLSIVGTLGGLGTPFLLYSDAGSLPGLVAYLCVILAGVSVLYLYRGWRSLLYVAFAGGWLALAIGLFSLTDPEAAPMPDRAALQAGIACAWLLFWLVPLYRAYHEHGPSARWRAPHEASYYRLGLLARPSLSLSILAPLAALAYSWYLWPSDERLWGWVALGASGVYLLTARYLYAAGRRPHGQAHGLAGTVLLTIGLVTLLDDDLLLVALAVEALVLTGVARRLDAAGFRLAARSLAVTTGLWLVGRILSDGAEHPVLVDADALADLTVILIVAGGAFALAHGRVRRLALLSAHLLFLGWLLRELAFVPDGQAYASFAWGAYAVGLLVVGLRRDVYLLRNTALATLLLVVGKLFLVDLAELEALWRILLFLTFGCVFLLLSYYVPSLWKQQAPPETHDALQQDR